MSNTQWMQNVRPGDYLWLIKEQELAEAVTAWEPPEPGHCAGRITIILARPSSTAGMIWQISRQEQWFVKGRGEGLDGQLLMRHILRPQWVRRFEWELAQLRNTTTEQLAAMQARLAEIARMAAEDYRSLDMLFAEEPARQPRRVVIRDRE